jgi:hypothetical protein
MTRSPLILLALALVGVTACSQSTGPVASDTHATVEAAPTPADPLATTPAPDWTIPRRVLFLHRSVGTALIRNGAVDMYDVLRELNAGHGTAIQMWHHGCGTDPYWDRYYDGSDQQVMPNFGTALTEPLYASPEHWKKIFCDADPQYVAARDSIDNFRVVIFKSGYDNTVAYASDRAGQWRQLYRAMKSSAIFADATRRIIVLGFPPMRRGMGTADQADADSSRAFNDWLVGDFVRDRANLFAFPLFDRLAGADNWLRDEYEITTNPNDSHPNAYGCEIVGRELMTFIYETATRDERPSKVTRQRHAAPSN